MRPATAIPAAAALALVLATAVAAAGQATGPDDILEAPGDALGVSQNDVRDEADHPHDENGFPLDGSVLSPDAPTRILEAYTEVRAGSPLLLVHGDEDLSNLLNHVLRDPDHTAYEHHMFPGQVTFEAYWGDWTDTQATGPAGVTDHAGVIDDRNDCEEAPGDEFTWRGPNPCLPEAQRTGDTMLGFVQPGTHDLHVNTLLFGCSCPTHAALANHSDRASQPELTYEPWMTDESQVWQTEHGFSRYEYDASLLITTKVTTAVNPTVLDDSSYPTRYDPHEPADGAAVHAVDVDVYESIHPLLEDAYRTSVWDPGDHHEEPVDPYPDNGIKGFAKDHRDCLTLYHPASKHLPDCLPPLPEGADAGRLLPGR